MFLRLISLLTLPIFLLVGANPVQAPMTADFQYFTPAGDMSSHIRFVPEVTEPLHGIYIASSTANSSVMNETMDRLASLKGNLVVIDVQTGGGRLAYPSRLETSLAIGNSGEVLTDMPGLVTQLHDKGFYVAARYVLFKNAFLAKAKPEWTLKKKGTNQPFNNRDGAIWLDPTHPELKNYLSDISLEISEAGFDEVQFDYVRFPEGGRGGAIYYSFTEDKTLTRDQAITAAVQEIAEKLHNKGVNVGLDIFGIVVWDNVSWKLIGQNISELAAYVDVLYPMAYPSHFGPGWGGHKNPGDEPYFFTQETAKKFMEQTAHTSVKIRPWLQGFAMNTSRFGPQYIKDQIRALSDIGINEYAVWNASNNYAATFRAL